VVFFGFVLCLDVDVHVSLFLLLLRQGVGGGGCFTIEADELFIRFDVWEEPLLLGNDGLIPIFYHVLRAAAAQFLCYLGPPLTDLEQQSHDALVLFGCPLSAEFKGVYCFLLGSRWLSQRSRHCLPVRR
jgi:hypothetical protein